ncbi:NAD-dependent epimerase/dehydratase family protein [Polymorphum gilvum]|uniref:3-beta hydroxysteroid dehydrogenase/isomerase family n=1 Tax=Polymorphum gilvum (strain LMG 25793 / CGMCC 1.9160 / SL003B-26A1) TaxID=991905 RepID=F2IW80_POLGS|nr:NAD-dependent epimerase/dehydratase family protein [Polymorphum gilvum]ADZ71465.1 3-beta hydroxysteroid dehydrogenase/isomerase family [Polymorphum gilvum SL003B-26A1]
MRRAVVFGGAGFIGTHLLTELGRSGAYDLLVSADIAEPERAVEGVSYRRIDVRDKIPADLCPGVDEVYNLAAVHRTPGHDTHEYYETNVTGAVNICAYAAQAGAGRLLFTSSIAVYGPEETAKSEATEPTPKSAYGWSKLLGERVHQRWQEADPARQLVIVRPAVIFGTGEKGNFTRLAGALKKGMFFFPGRKDTVKACGYVGELVRSMDFMLSRNEPFTLYNFCYPTPYTIEQICDSFGRVGGLPRPRGTVPLALLNLASLPFELLDALGVRNGINRERIRKLVVSTNIVPQTLVDVGYRYETDLDKAIAEWKAAAPQGRFS